MTIEDHICAYCGKKHTDEPGVAWTKEDECLACSEDRELVLAVERFGLDEVERACERFFRGR